LDLLTVKQQINQMVQERVTTRNEFLDKLDRAEEELARQGEAWQRLAERMETSRTSWLLAGLTEGLALRRPAPPCPLPHTVVATDGSQIFPDRHEVASCYLINIGRVAIAYGRRQRPLLDSRPTLFYRDRDLYHFWGGRRVLITPEVLAMRRMLMELADLAMLAQESREGAPCLALSDGTLILWALEGAPPDYQRPVLGSFLASLERFRELGVPLAGYISHPGSTDVINALRVGLCPEARVDCDRCPWREPEREGVEEWGREGGEEPRSFLPSRTMDWPCAVIEGVTDALLFARVLAPGERSALFRSQSQILRAYGVHTVYFFYVNVGDEMARVEVPLWVAEDENRLDFVHAGVVDQARKGQGYPVTLTEAHEKAVIRGRDRDLFFQMVRETLVANDLPVHVSSKSWAKRAPRV